ncbi:MAG TPA: extracellular solute-binding protein [Verrucomicrobiae bacterium]|jgi:ABC-type glycerol-3-phosphate transport system substrate-binding protein
MKRLFPAILAALVATLSAPASDAKKPLEIWISSYQDKVYYEEMVKLYKAKDPKFEAKVSAFGFREMPDKLAVAIKTRVNPPDIVQLDEVIFGMYLAGQVPFVDLTERVKKAHLDKDILPQRMSLFTYKGRTYGVPQSLSASVLFYRTDTLEKLNLTEADLATWDNFMRVGERLAAKQQGMIGLDASYFEILLRQRGSDLFGKDGNAFPDRKLAVEVLKFLLDIQNKHIGRTPDRGSIFDPVFFSGDVANEEVFCVIGGEWYGLDMIQQFASDLKGKWAAAPLPAWLKGPNKLGPRTSTFAGQGLLIYMGTKEVEPAWKFIEFVMTDREANVKRFTGGNSFPAYKPAWEDARLKQPMEFFNNQSLGELLIDLAPEIPPVVMSPKRPKAVFMLQESFFAQVMAGAMTPEQCIDQMKAILDKND